MKRSAQVALVLMSAATVGGVGYAMMPRQNCVPPPGATPNAANQPCASSRSSSYFHSSGRPILGLFGSSDSGSSTSTTSTTSTTSRSPVGAQRGGFGGTFSSLAPRGG